MSKRNIEEIVAEAKQWGMLANPADIHTLIAENFALAAENARLREALTESRRFMDYFANGRTSFTGPGTPTSCLAHIDWALNPNRAALSPPIASAQSAPKPTQPPECKQDMACPNMKEVGGGFYGERYRCDVCGAGFFLDYEEMK